MGRFTTKQIVILSGIGLLGVALLLMLLGVLPGRKLEEERGFSANLTVWGVFDTRKVWKDLEGSFNRNNRVGGSVKIRYRQIPFDEYEEELLNALAAGRGPDMFYIHNPWLPKFIDKVAPMPQTQGEENVWTTFPQYQEAFVDVVSDDFTREQTIYAVPFYVDTLALYYNRDMLNAVGIAEPPETWEEFQEAVERLTILDINGNIIRSGAAIGTARNINRSTDILGLLMLQTFGDLSIVDVERNIVNLSRSFRVDGDRIFPGTEALRFYTDFASPALASYTWNRNQHYSIDAFLEENAAMMFNYSHHIATIENRAPQLNFSVTRAPQLAELVEQRRAIDYASYFGLAVSGSVTQEKYVPAWRFVEYLMTPQAQRVYQEATDRPPARRDMVDEARGRLHYEIFADQSLTARSWFQPDAIRVETILADMIESVIDGTAVREALVRAEGQIEVLLRRLPELKEDNRGGSPFGL